MVGKVIILAAVLGSNTVTLSSPAWNAFQVAPYGIDIGAVKGPDYIKVVDNGSGSTGVYFACFDSSSDEQVHFSSVIPRMANDGSMSATTVYWFQNGAGTGNVVFAYEVVAANTGAALGNSTIVSQTFAAAGTTLEIVKSEFPAVPFIGSTEDTASAARFFRDANNAADTLAVDACVISFRINHTVDKIARGAR
jgi:hypothetical protein